MSELRRQFEVNVFGTVAVIKAVLPGMRVRCAGHILAITSIGGLTTSPGLSFYHSNKYALAGILESLGKEVAHLGIHVTAVKPGPFRTDWSARSMFCALEAARHSGHLTIKLPYTPSQNAHHPVQNWLVRVHRRRYNFHNTIHIDTTEKILLMHKDVTIHILYEGDDYDHRDFYPPRARR